MATKPNSAKTTATDPFAAMREAGLQNAMGFGAAWMEAMGQMGAEVASFLAARIQEDVETQKKLLNCQNIEEVQHVQAEFIQTAVDQYQAETGKLMEMGTRALAGGNKKTSPGP